MIAGVFVVQSIQIGSQSAKLQEETQNDPCFLYWHRVRPSQLLNIRIHPSVVYSPQQSTGQVVSLVILTLGLFLLTGAG